MMQVITFLIMGFVVYKILSVFQKQLGINFKDLLDFNKNSVGNLERQQIKLQKKADKLAKEKEMRDKIEELKQDIQRREDEK